MAGTGGRRNEPAPGSGSRRGGRRSGGGPRRSRRGAGRTARAVPDPSDAADAEVRFIQPFQATKPYLCPGCNQTIPPGVGHLVVIPPDEVDLRRHWHRGCWLNRTNRY